MAHFRLAPLGAVGFSSAFGLAGLSVVLGGCGNPSEPVETPARCDRDADCEAGQICQRLEGETTLAVVAPCQYVSCFDGVGCSGDLVCAPASQAPPSTFPFNPVSCGTMLCLPPCPSRACGADEVCMESGLCELQRCDAPNAAACPASWHCDPAAAETETVTQNGSEVLDADPTRAIARGCVRDRCDQEQGHTCRAGWRCAPDEAEDGSGCVPIPCEESGICSAETLICAPTGDRSRPQGMDFFGCVPRNCEEGASCTYLVDNVDVGLCDFDAPDADVSGCATLSCSETDGLCFPFQVCEPTAPSVDTRGCRMANCADPNGPACSAGWTCDPSAAGAPPGCVETSPPGTGGSNAGGDANGGATSGGGPGTGGAGTGGTSSGTGGTTAGGSTGGAGENPAETGGSSPISNGHCVDP